MGRTIELAQRIREAAGHGEDAAGLVLQNDHRSLHHRPYAQVGTCGRLPAAVTHAGQDHIVERELALCGRIVERERQNAPVGQPDTPRLALLAGRFLQHDGGRPVHIIKWQPRSRERPLPSRPLVAGFLVSLDA